MSLTFADYQRSTNRFAVDRELVLLAIATCDPLAVAALSVYGLQHVWHSALPVYPVMTSPRDNGGWGHLMPVWFKPHERPVPLCTLDNWALFALVYAHSFGQSDEAQRLIARSFGVENLVRVVVGTNMLIPFLPTTQGRGLFLRHGMLPFLLAILWLDDVARRDWLHLHDLGAAHFAATSGLVACEDPIGALSQLEFSIFAGIERNDITDDQAVAALLASDSSAPPGGPTLLRLYQDLFGAICLGIAALAGRYEQKRLDDWRVWAPQEIGVDYRLSDYAIDAIYTVLRRSHV